MPTYEYECTSCGKVFELFQPITEPPRKKLRKGDRRPCKCNAAVTRRISAGGGLIFKGSGFYITDYRSDGYKKAAESESGAAKPKTDDKPSSANKGIAAGAFTESAASASTGASPAESDAPGSKPAAAAKSSRKKH